MSNTFYTKAFTLIELLVVIGIISLLSSIIFASVGNVREKAKIANIRQNLANMINAAELSFNSNYVGACSAVQPMIDAIENNGGYAACYTHATQGINRERWAVSAHLISDRTKNYSVDSDGVVEWDAENKPNASWNNAISVCQADNGKKLPTMEMLKSLDLAQLKHNGLRESSEYGFPNNYLWSSTVNPLATNESFRVFLANGGVVSLSQTISRTFRCVG